MRQLTACCIFDRRSGSWLSDSGELTRSFSKAALFQESDADARVQQMLSLGSLTGDLALQRVQATWTITQQRPVS